MAVAVTVLGLVGVIGRTGGFALYAAMTAGTFVFARFMVPKTKGLDLEAVEALWLERTPNGPPVPRTFKLPI